MKDAPNNVPMNMTGLAQTSREILENVGVPIFLGVIITPDSLHFNCDRTGILLDRVQPKTSHFSTRYHI